MLSLINILHVGLISTSLAKVFIKSSMPCLASSSDIIIAVQCDKFISLIFSKFNIAIPKLKELQVTVLDSVVILVPDPSDESGLAICNVRAKGSSGESDISNPIAMA